jgi:hypothetical protein
MSSPRSKNISLHGLVETALLIPTVSSHKGRIAIVTDAGWAFYQCQTHTRPRVPWASGVPHALEGARDLSTARALRADVHLAVIASAAKQAIFCRGYGLLRGACHRARIRATRWLAMTVLNYRGCLKFESVNEWSERFRSGLVRPSRS